MSANDPSRHFLGLWRRALNQPSLAALLPTTVEAWASPDLVVEAVEQRDVGAFSPTPSIVLKTPIGSACFPLVPNTGDPSWEARRTAREHRASLWQRMEWFEPPWVPRGRVGELIKEAEACRTNERAVEVFDYHTSTLYTVPFEAVCVAQLMPKSRALREFCPLVREAFLAFYSGSRASSIAAMIPVVEGALSRIVSRVGGDDLTTPDKINVVIDGAISRAATLYFGGMWVPREYATMEYLFPLDEHVLILETFRRWLLGSFFRRTGEYNGATWLNRHLFAHGASSSWQQSANFRRILVALATIGLVESWHDGTADITVLFPEMNDDGQLLWQEALFQGEAQMVLKSLAERRYHEHGRLVPELPTDDGALLRRALLSDDCINDLVRPLRDAGWSVDVGEPEETGLYMTVRAKAGDRELNVALLYSCATANATYKALAEDVDVILYRGAPYHQQNYAYGIDMHVGPVTGWQPPKGQAGTCQRV